MAMDVYGLCLGGNVFGWTADRDASFAVLDAYVEAGGNFIDTADTYMRPNMGISETIIGEWMAARGNRDSLVIATKVGSDGGLSAANIAAARRRVARAAADRPDRPLLRPQGRRRRCRSRRPCARSTQTVRDGKVLHVAASNVAAGAARRVAGAGRARGPGAPTSGCSRTTTSSSARATSATTRRSSRAHGLSVAPYYALAGRLPDRQVPQPVGRRRQPASGMVSQYLDDPRGERVLDALDEIAADARRRRRPRSRSPGCWPSRASSRRSRSARTRRAARRHPPGRPSARPPSEITQLDEASA